MGTLGGFLAVLVMGGIAYAWFASWFQRVTTPSSPPPAPPGPTHDELIAAAEEQAAQMVADARSRGRRYVEQRRGQLARIQAESATRTERILSKQKSGWE